MGSWMAIIEKFEINNMFKEKMVITLIFPFSINFIAF